MNASSSLFLLLVIDGFPVAGYGTEAHHRRLIAAGLLAALRAADDFSLTAAEIDAEDEVLLLHRPGPVPSPAQVLAQARRMFEAFHLWIADFQLAQPCGCLTCRRATGLNLRIVAHAGPLAFTTSHGPRGEAIWQLYDLLFDDDRTHEYVLLTDALLGTERRVASFWNGARRGSCASGALGEISYVSVNLRAAGEILSRQPAVVPGSPFFSLSWTLEVLGIPNRLGLN